MPRPLLPMWCKRTAFFFLCLILNSSLYATPDCPIVTERFQGLANGTTVNASANGWYLNASQVLSTGYFAVKSNRFHAEELGGEGIWYSRVFSTAGYTDFQAAVKITAEGDLNSSEYVKIYYKVNGGSEILLDQRTGNFGTIDFISPVLNGNNVQLVVKIYNYNNGGSQTSKYYVEEYRVFKEHGPCAAGSISVTASAANNGILTCANASLSLTAASSASGVTYSWAGPGGFTATGTSATVSTAGTYTVVGTNTTGSGSATITVTENKTPPDLAASGGALGCLASIVINASSAVSNATYSWTGPGGFTSTNRTPAVSTAGTYTVTVTNPSNGCTASQSVQVTSGTAATSDIWIENFTLSNNTTVDNGTTGWTSSKPVSSAVFAVNNNEFRASGIGITGDGIWTSGSFTITGKTNVSISVNTRSSGVAMNETGTYADYIRFYYKLNGGSEVMFAEKKGNINSHSTTNSTVSVNGLSGSTLQIIVKARATGSDEFYYFDNVNVTGVNQAVTLSTSVNGTATCNSTAQINLSASGTVSSYVWTGPNGFTSTQQNPVVSAGGQYSVTATLPNGCTVSALATVTENKTLPDVTATGGTLGCLNSVVINASSSIGNATYSWTGPNGFTSTSKNPSVSAPGTYTVTVTNPTNGCTAPQSVTVTSGVAAPVNLWVENFTFSNNTNVDNGTTPWSVTNPSGSVFAVNNNELRVSAIGTAAQGIWTSGLISITGKTNVTITGKARSSITGSAVMNETGEYADYIQFYYKLNGGPEVMFAEKRGIINSHSTTPAVVTISGLSGTSLQVIVKSRATGGDEFYYFDDVVVAGSTQDNVTATATVNGTLSCSVLSVSLSGSSDVTGVTYSWSGPGGFTSVVQNPVVSAAGNYILTVTNPATGCTANATATVVQHTTAPNLTAVKPDTLTCTRSSVTLTASTTTPQTTITWTGFAANQHQVTVSTGGKYYVTAKDTVNGCIKSDSVLVIIDNAKPNLSVTVPVILTCTVTSVSLSANSTTPGTSITWTGMPTGQNPANASTPGKFFVTATGSNGCVQKDSVTVMQNTVPPDLTITAPGSINCTNDPVNLLASSATPNHTITWTGFPAGQNPVTVTSGGKYYVTVKNNVNGCIKVDSVTLLQSTVVPEGVTATNNGPLTCIKTTAILTGNSSTANASYSWTGPNGFTASTATAGATLPGIYTLQVTHPVSGCSVTTSTTVAQDITAPATATTNSGGTLNCRNAVFTLSGNSTTQGVTYLWTGPNGYTSPNRFSTISVPGAYQLTVTLPSTGCTKTSAVLNVALDTAKPQVTIQQPAPLSCAITSVRLNAIPNPSGSNVTWTGFATNLFPVTVSAAGTYYVTVEGLNGCTKVDSVTVVANNTPPSLSIIPPAILNCNNASVTLTAGSDAAITWDGFSAGQNPVSVSAPGKYYVTVTTTSGCTNRDSVEVLQDAIMPTLSVVPPAVLNCLNTTISLQAISNGTITWTGFAMGQNPISVNTPGQYTVTAVSANGCVKQETVTVVQEITLPTLSVTTPSILTCVTTSVPLQATSNGTITWTGFAAGENPITVSAPGTYHVIAKSANGCIKEENVIVTQNITQPTLSVTPPATLNCTNTTVSLQATSNGTVTWTGFATGENPITISEPGTYHVTARAANGCIKEEDIIVTAQTELPTLSITPPATLNCLNTSVNLHAVSNGTVTWTGFAVGQNPVSVNAPGTYTVTARNANGCVKMETVTVIQSVIPPTLGVTTPATLTCTITSVSLQATSNGTITWTGFAAGENPIMISTPGTYHVTARSANGCIKEEDVIVTQNITLPTLSVAPPAVLDCLNPIISLQAVSNGAVTWTGFAAGENPILVNEPGTYHVTARSANGCIKEEDIIVTQDITEPTLSVVPPALLTCTTTSVTLSATSNGTITWDGTPTGQNSINVSVPGGYLVTARSANGCLTQEIIPVTQDIIKPTLSVTPPATLTCITTSVPLQATSNGSIRWTGFAAGENPISVNTPGNYTVTATGANGCTKQETVTVIQDITQPTLSIIPPAVLTCMATSVSLQATSNGTVTWTGFATGENPITISEPGTYHVTARAVNGCTKEEDVIVTKDITKPTLSVTPPAASLNCGTTSITLTATSNGTVTWTGFAPGQNAISVSESGVYTVIARAANGCVEQENVTVTQDNTLPTLTITPPATLTCANTSITLTATSNGTITWTGFAVGENPVSINQPGTYHVTARLVNGCIKEEDVIVTRDITEPTLSITPPATLTCTTTSVSLQATSNGTITWAGFATGENPVSVNTPGTYTVTARNVNGCTKQETVTVIQDITQPTLSITTPAILTCATTSVSLQATSNGTVTWTGFATGENPITISEPGTYHVTARASNGCIREEDVIVTQENGLPSLIVTPPATLTCSTTSVSLQASSNGTITWSGFATGENPVSVNTPGTYTVTARNANGCAKQETVTVLKDITPPTLSVAPPATLTCANTSVSLQATSNGSVTWTGFATGENPVTITTPGTYHVTARASNGCTSEEDVIVTQDITPPTLSITPPAILTCATTSVSLQATSNGTITWSGFATGENPITISEPGTYHVVTRAANGCIKEEDVIVAQDITEPTLSITPPFILTCTTTSITLTANSNGTVTWTGFATGENPVSINAPGTYTATARSANGCVKQETITVIQDITLPALSVAPPATLTCAITSISLNATSNGTVTWTGFTAGENPVTITAPGTYHVTAKAANGCISEEDVIVTQNITQPTLSVTPPAILTCSTTTVSLQATSNGTVTWTGFATGENPVTISEPGTYHVIARADNGCIKEEDVIITQDITPPTLSIIPPAILTCTNTSIALTANSNGVITWTDFGTGENPVAISTPGTYHVTARAANGCEKQETVTVVQDITPPTLSISTPPILTCTTTSATLTATSNGTVTWAGHAAGESSITVTEAGTYHVTARAANGCIAEESVTVIRDNSKPENVTVSNDGPLTCGKTSVTLTGGSSTTGSIYRWVGPNLDVLNNIATANTPGTHTFTAKHPVTGCIETITSEVVKVTVVPANVSANNNGPLTCTKLMVNLTSSTSTSGVTFKWTNALGFSVNGPSATTNTPGLYTLTVTHTATGCVTTANTNVIQNITKPASVIIPSGTPEPLSTNIITAQQVSGVSYLWTIASADPNWMILSGANAAQMLYQAGDVGGSGTISLKVTSNSNGCSDTSSLTLTPEAVMLMNKVMTVPKPVAATVPGFTYKTWPNPFTERAFISFKPVTSAWVTVAIYDHYGSLVQVLFHEMARSGQTYELTFKAGNLAAGMYHCVIRTDGQVYKHKMIMVR